MILLPARLAQLVTHVVAFDPGASLLSILGDQIKWKGVLNATVVPARPEAISLDVSLIADHRRLP